MNWKIVPISCIVLIAPAKLFFARWNHDAFEVCAWLIGSAGWAWIAWAYWRDRDMPAYAGSFSFDEGRNQLARAVYMNSMLLIYIGGAVFA